MCTNSSSQHTVPPTYYGQALLLNSGPLLGSEWRRPWSSVVNVSDASEEGFGVCSSIWSPETVGEVGRGHERERFRRSGSHNARESALTSAGFAKDEATGKWRAGLVEDEDYLASSGWALNDSPPEVPKDCLDSGSWTTVRQGPWKRHEHIVHLEARALVKSFEHVVHDCGLSDCRQLFLVDSMSAALAFDRCRSKNFRMLRQIRKFCSFSLARNIAFSVRWLPSELNPADAPSRATASQRVAPNIFHQRPWEFWAMPQHRTMTLAPPGSHSSASRRSHSRKAKMSSGSSGSSSRALVHRRRGAAKFWLAAANTGCGNMWTKPWKPQPKASACWKRKP